MSANYKLVRNPNPTGAAEEQALHPRFVSNGTISTNTLIQHAQSRSSFSPADMKGILQLLQDLIADYLTAGNNVELDGIGTFSISLQGRPVMDKKEIRSESIHFKDVKFRSSKKLRDRLKTMPVYRDENEASDRKHLTPLQCKENLSWYLENHPYITIKEYANLCYCEKTKASTDLKRLTSEGKLRMERLGSNKLYYSVKPSEEDFNKLKG